MSHPAPQGEAADVSSGSSAPPEPPRGPHVARADSLFRTKRGVIVLLIVGWGVWSAWHGFVTWPREASEFQRIEGELGRLEPGSLRAVELREEQKLYTYHSATDILFNRLMAIVLPPLGLLLFAQSLYVSRGTVSLDEADTLHVPGHGQVPLSAVMRLDDTRWTRKGIAYIHYQSPEGIARVRLDHDWYEPKAIHAIHDRLAYLLAERDKGTSH